MLPSICIEYSNELFLARFLKILEYCKRKEQYGSTNFDMNENGSILFYYKASESYKFKT